MSIWDTYLDRAEIRGSTKREAVLNRTKRNLLNHIEDNLSYHNATVNKVSRKVAIIDSDNLNIKTIISMPCETFECGSIVCWADNHWIITEVDANTEVRTKGKMTQCNYLLNWIDTDGIIHKQWCIIEDGTKYLTGELEDRNFVTTRGDSRIAMTITKNDDTVRFNRESRFIIDDDESQQPLAYQLTKPLKIGRTYNNKGIFAFVLQEVTTTDYDNKELKIADYYKYNKKPNEELPSNNRKGWI